MSCADHTQTLEGAIPAMPKSPCRFGPARRSSPLRGHTACNFLTKIKPCLITAWLLGVTTSVFGQTAVSTSTNPEATATPQASPAPQTEEAAPRIPAIDELDQAFKQTSLGKAADEARLHAQWRELSNRIINDPDMVAARTKADQMKTDLAKRQQLRVYYTMFYDRIRALAATPELKTYIDTHKTQHLGLTAQNRVRPSPSPAAKPKPRPKTEAPKVRGSVPEPPLPQ